MMKHTLSSVIKKIRSRSSAPLFLPRYLIALVVILVVALDLRLQSAIHTEMVSPVRADAREYVLYAYNLKTFGVFSQSDTLSAQTPTSVVPDAKRTPLYPLFLAPFLDKPITAQNLTTIRLAQAILSTLTVLMVFQLCRVVLPIAFALGATALTALSPHLVTMNVYLLSEALFCFLLVTTIYLTAMAFERKSKTLAAIAGAILAGASLTHPMATYFILPLLLFLLFIRGWKAGYRPATMLLLGFCLIFGPWIARNVMTLSSAGDNNLIRIVLRTGAYTDLMYKGDRESFPFPYRADPDFAETSKNLPAALSEIARSFREAPVEQLRWYLVGKPLLLYSWDLVEGQHIDRRGDVFTYPVTSTPYNYLLHFRATHSFMRVTHWLFVVSMLVAMVTVWLPRRMSGLSPSAALILRMISLLLGYHLAVMIVGVPTPRYSLPMRPFMYVMAMLPFAWGVQRFMRARSPR